MLKAGYRHHQLEFKRPGGTSRGVLHKKDTWFLILKDQQRWGIGECGMFKGLSADDRPDFEDRLDWLCQQIDRGFEELYEELADFPALRMGLETAWRSLHCEQPFQLYPSGFTQGSQGILINGLVWMGSLDFMKEQIAQKLDEGFSCLKLKIGAIDFKAELELLKGIRKEYAPELIEIRVDANGAFSPLEALEKLKRLSDYQLHSIEQPIRAGRWDEMAALCEHSPLPIALDEELIGVKEVHDKEALLQAVKPHYIILKPTLVGGFTSCDQWIGLAEKQGTGWWITSALESNIGLNAIAQYTFTKNSKLPQGLGTGGLFTNNIESPLRVSHGYLRYLSQDSWNLDVLNIKKVDYVHRTGI